MVLAGRVRGVTGWAFRLVGYWVLASARFTMSDETYDVAIIGAGPAGAVAAHCLAKNGHRVLLLDRAVFPRSTACSGWVSAHVPAMLKDVGIESAKMFDQPFSDVVIHSADFSKAAKPTFESPPGYLVDRAAFDGALVKCAVASGAAFQPETEIARIHLGESSATLTSREGRAFESRLLALASGRMSPLAESIGFPSLSGGSRWVATASAEGKQVKGPKVPRVAIVLGLDGASSFGFVRLYKDHVSVDVAWDGDKADATRALIGLCKALTGRKLIPVDLLDSAVKAEPMRSTAAAAIDMDTHVCKHTLLIGEAGGFVSAVSNEGIYPAIWSATIAAEVLEDALSSQHSQDALIAFNSAWRMKMAEHLRSPHTDVRFLLPLVFSNQPMANRMAAAFFFGDNI